MSALVRLLKSGGLTLTCNIVPQRCFDAYVEIRAFATKDRLLKQIAVQERLDPIKLPVGEQASVL